MIHKWKVDAKNPSTKPQWGLTAPPAHAHIVRGRLPNQYVLAPCVASSAACGSPLLEAACGQHVLPAGPPSALPSALPEGNICIAVCSRASLASAPCCGGCCCCGCSCSSPGVVTCHFTRRHAAALLSPQLQPRRAPRPRAAGAAYVAAGYETFVQHRFMVFLCSFSSSFI